MKPLVTEACVAQARRSPDAIAVTDGRTHVTYAELLRAATRVAASLSARQGPSRTPVGICLERSPRLIVAVLATLLSGRAYVPLDSSYPTRRLHHMIDGSGVSAVLCEERTYEVVADCPTSSKPVEWIRLDTEDEAAAHDAPTGEHPAVPLGPDDPAYVLYTSGSTGVPKGVAMSHGPLARLIDWHRRTDGPQADLLTAQFAPISFDVSFQEIFSTLCAGGTLLLVGEETRRNPDALLTLMSEQGVTRLFLPAAALHQIALHAATGPSRARLRDIVCAGEQLQVTQAVREWLSTMPGCPAARLPGCQVAEGRFAGGVGRDWSMLERWAIDDGLHAPQVEVDIVASARRGEDMVTVRCVCGGMAAVMVPRADRLAPHAAHFHASQQIKGPSRPSLGVRVTLLMLADLALFLAAQIAGSRIVPHLDSAAAITARLAFILVGVAAAATLTVSLRNYIAPGRLPRVS